MSDTTPPRPAAGPAADGRSGGEREAAAEELGRLLPRPAAWDLPREHHLHRKDLLMQQIDHDRAAPAAAAAPTAPRRRPRPAVLVPVTALALAGAVAAGLTLGGGGHGTSARPHTEPPARQATVLLDRISDVALAGDATPVRDGQFVYVRSTGQGADETSGKAVTGPPEPREVWLSQRPGPAKRLGVIRQDGATLPINAELGDRNGTPAGLSRPTYGWLAALPTDPHALLAYLYATTRQTDGKERDQEVFEQIGELVGEAVMPPATAAALYRAAAQIPGVVADPAATDAAGRHGLGIRRDDTRYAERTEWVFDAHDLSFLGSRTYLTRDTAVGRKGVLLSSEAVLERAVVDREGERPTAAQVRESATRTSRG